MAMLLRIFARQRQLQASSGLSPLTALNVGTILKDLDLFKLRTFTLHFALISVLFCRYIAHGINEGQICHVTKEPKNSSYYVSYAAPIRNYFTDSAPITLEDDLVVFLWKQTTSLDRNVKLVLYCN